MFKVIILVARKVGMARTDFIHHYETVHVPLVRSMIPQLVEYRRNYINPADTVAMPGASEPDFDVITEMWFRDRRGYEDLNVLNADPVKGALLAEDAVKFMDAGKTRMLVVGEYAGLAARGPIPVRLPAGDIVGFGAQPAVAAWLFLPAALDPAATQRVAFCIHGGGYSKRYFHIDEAGVDGYSLCRHFAERGMITVAIDCLGSGESAKAEVAQNIVSETLTLAHHNALGFLLAKLASGDLVAGLPPLPRLLAIGVGHSLGGMLLALQQARHRSFPRIAVLGWSNLGISLPPEALTPTLDSTGTYAYGTAALRREFHLDDVPAAVLATTAEGENLPVSLALAVEAANRASVRAAVAAIDVPVFLGYGAKDTSVAPYDEAGCYIGARDITLFILEGSAHCHNFAGTRARLWDRVLRWADWQN